MKMKEFLYDVMCMTLMAIVLFAILWLLAGCSSASGAERTAVTTTTLAPRSGHMTVRRGDTVGVLFADSRALQVTATIVVFGSRIEVTYASIDEDTQAEIGGTFSFVRVGEDVYSRTLYAPGLLVETWILAAAPARRLVTGLEPDGNFFVDESWTTTRNMSRK